MTLELPGRGEYTALDTDATWVPQRTAERGLRRYAWGQGWFGQPSPTEDYIVTDIVHNMGCDNYVWRLWARLRVP